MGKGFDTARMVMVTGKGGIGKSVATAILGLRYARQGQKVLLVENAAFSQVPPLFGKESQGHTEVELAEGLFTSNLNTPECFREYVVNYLGQERLFRHIMGNRLVRSFLNAIPGLGETLVLGRLYFTLDVRKGRKFDKVIFDGPAFGHFYQLVHTPATVLNSGIVGPLASEVEKVRSFLSAPATAAVVVSTPERLVATECADFVPKFDGDSPVRLGGIILNRSWLSDDSDYAVLGPAADAYVSERRQEEEVVQAQLLDLLQSVVPKGEGAFYRIPEVGAIRDGELEALYPLLTKEFERGGSHEH